MRAIIISLCLLALSSAAHAHGGSLNKQGCYNNRKTGDYHCHQGAKAKPQKRAGPALSGIPKIIDGDTIRIGSTRIRLHGIDAPEAKQTCTAGGKQWPCGREATKALTVIIGDRSVSCNRRDVDRYGRIVAVCRAGAININAWMVSQGWAVAYRRFSMDYVRDEDTARGAQKGPWRGEFAMPWDWRRRKR